MDLAMKNNDLEMMELLKKFGATVPQTPDNALTASEEIPKLISRTHLISIYDLTKSVEQSKSSVLGNQ
jgi:hypothetical protein